MKLLEYLSSLHPLAKLGLGVGVAAVSVVIIRRSIRKKRSRPLKKDWKTDVLYLYQFPPSPKVPSISPFSIKLEMWLRINSLSYENVPIAPGVFSKEGQIPFVEINGREYCDSGFIIDHLTKLYNLEDGLNPEQRGIARAFEQMIENVTFWSYSQVRYIEKIKEFYCESALGWNLSPITMKLTQLFLSSAMRTKLHWHGIGRHGRDDVIQVGLDDLKAISNFLGEKQYMLGPAASRADASVFGLLVQILYFPVENPHAGAIRKHYPNLIVYTERLKKEFWPDWDSLYKDYPWKKQIK